MNSADFSVARESPHCCLDDVLRRSEARFCRTDQAVASVDDRLAATFDEIADLFETEGDVAQWMQRVVDFVQGGRPRIT